MRRRQIAFSNIVSADKESVAEYFFMQLVSLARGAGRHQWKTGEEHELVGQTIGIIGLGEVGKAMAHMALAYKMEVIYHSPHRKPAWEAKGLTYVPTETLLQQSQIVAVCSPTNAEVLDASKFNLMQPGSILIQASSGTPFSQQSFKDWISQEGNFAMFDMSAGAHNFQAYKDLPRVIFSTKVAGDTYESDERRGKRALENLKAFLDELSGSTLVSDVQDRQAEQTQVP